MIASDPNVSSVTGEISRAESGSQLASGLPAKWLAKIVTNNTLRRHSFFGAYDETIEVNADSMNARRLQEGTIPLLTDHDAVMRGVAGRMISLELDETRGDVHGVIQLADDAAGEALAQRWSQGIGTGISCAIKGEDVDTVKNNNGTVKSITFKKWELMEVSAVAVPADATTTIKGAVRTDETTKKYDAPASATGVNTMPTTFTNADGQQATTIRSETQTVEATRDEHAKVQAAEKLRLDDLTTARDKAISTAEDRKESIEAIYEAAVKRGTSPTDFRLDMLQEQAMSRANTAVKLAEKTDIGLTDKEVNNFSILRAIDARASKKKTFETEVSDAEQVLRGKEPHDEGSLFIPYEVLNNPVRQPYMSVDDATSQLDTKRAFSFSLDNDAKGEHWVQDTIHHEHFVEVLKERSVVFGMGLTHLMGLVGNVVIPRQSGRISAYWVGEGEAPTESDHEVEDFMLSLKTIGTFTRIHRQLVKNTTFGVEEWVRRQLFEEIALKWQEGILAGSGSNSQPTGITNETGIHVVSIGTNGGALNWQHIVNLETAIMNANSSLQGFAYLTTPSVRGQLKQRYERPADTTNFTLTADSRLWKGGEGAMGSMGMLNDHPAYATNAVARNLTKGTGTDLHRMYAGIWPRVLAAMWGGMELLVNPYTNDVERQLRLTLFCDVDNRVDRPTQMAVINDIVV